MGRTTPSETAGYVREDLAAGRREWAMRAIWQLAGDLWAVSADLLPALTATAPGLTGDVRFDALLAALVDHVLTANGLAPPEWVDEASRRLSEPWDVEPVAALREDARAATPEAIRRHGVFLDPSELLNL